MRSSETLRDGSAGPAKPLRVPVRETGTHGTIRLRGARGVRLRAAARAAVVAALVAPMSPAAAQAPAKAADAALARALKEGAAASARGDHAGCAAAFTTALELSADAEVAGKLGLCEEALGRYVAAFDHLRFAQEREPVPSAGGGRGLWKQIADAVERLYRRVVRALVFVSPPDAEVLLDGTPIGRGWSGRYVTVTPGEHTWTARREGHDDATFTHFARAGDLPDVHLTVVARPAAPPSPPCDEACRAALRAEGARAAEAKLRAWVRAEVELGIRRRMEPGVSFLAGGLLSLGLTADPGPGFLVGGELSWGAFDKLSFTAGLEAQALLPTRVFTLANGERQDITQLTAGLVPCVRYKWVSGCAFADVGMLIASGPPSAFPEGHVRATAGLGPRIGFQLPFAERFMVRAFAALRFSPVDTGIRAGYGPDAQPTHVWPNPLVSGLIGLSFSIGSPIRYEAQP